MRKLTNSPCRVIPGKLSCTTSVGDEQCSMCGRTVEEIRQWNGYSDIEKAKINKRLAKTHNEDRYHDS